MKKFIYIILAAAAMMFFAGEANAQMGKRYFGRLNENSGAVSAFVLPEF